MAFELAEEHLDPTSEITLDTVKERAVKGVAVLTGRTFFLSFLSLIATGFLTVLLEPSDFGIFWVVSAVVNFLAYFSDVGLAAALIQKKGKVTEEELRTTFFIQQILVITLVLILFLGSGRIKDFYGLSDTGIYLLYALGVSFIMSSLKTIPSVLLERDLNFSKLVIPQVIENLVYNVVAVILAWLGFGVASFTWAVLARGAVGLIAIYIIMPWKPAFAFSRKSLRGLLKFGLPYQANTFLATVKDDGMTAFLGGVLGTTGMGYLGWAQKWGYMPLRLFMDHVLKVTFPAFSRMQEEKAHLQRSVTRSIFFVCFLVFPSTIGLLVLAPELIAIIPRYEKWLPAIVPLGFIAISTFFASATTQLTNLLNAIGKISVTFKLMVMWTGLTWLVVPFLATKYGVNGAASGYALVSSSSIIAIFIARRYVRFSIIDGVFRPFIASFIMGAILILLRNLLPTSLLSVLTMVFLGGSSYIAISYFLIGSSLVTDAKKVYRNIKG